MEMLESKLDALEARYPEAPKTFIAGGTGIGPPTQRNSKVVSAFKEVNACPSTGKLGDHPCPGFVVDHPWSLCLGGPDIVENMRWQSNIEAQIKDVFERDMCAVKRKLEATPK